jgi:hypothetical protein
MPIGDIASEALGGIARVIGRIIVELLFEVIIQGTGYVLLRIFRPRAEPSDTACAVVGLLFWVGVAAAGYWLHSHVVV